MTAPELDIRVSLETLAKFSADGQVYRAHAHAIAAGPGWLVLVPIELVDGDLTTVIDQCPAPWQEVMALLDEPAAKPGMFSSDVWAESGGFAVALASSNWDMDDVDIGGVKRAKRLFHPSGIRIGVVYNGGPS